MRVMVTGATTPLGAAIIDHLLDGCDVDHVLAVGREPEGPLRDKRITYRRADLCRSREVHDLVWGQARDLDIATVIHACQHRGAHDHGPRVHQQNVCSMRDLLAACANHPTITRVVVRSFAEVYASRHGTAELVDENAPLELAPHAPQWIRDRVEADLVACAAPAGPLEVIVLRCAEIVAPDVGSQLWDYLQSRVCVRPLGFDPMINVLSLEDAAAAFAAAVESAAVGAYNIAGFDTLPLSRAIAEAGRPQLPTPTNRGVHFGGMLDGTRARKDLGYVPRTPVRWPRPWWRTLLERLARLPAESAS
ncbi:MAG: NAD-dependent epimerase/dehydratase family protein [Deltaproteobacteria bacterium]|nr:NAD-dependent epimerase/dehydratase family protein [Deltaproteobacteria bacterium]